MHDRHPWNNVFKTTNELLGEHYLYPLDTYFRSLLDEGCFKTKLKTAKLERSSKLGPRISNTRALNSHSVSEAYIFEIPVLPASDRYTSNSHSRRDGSNDS